MLVGAALLVPHRTICNPINDFQLGRATFIDTSLGVVVSDMLKPPQQSTLNGALTQARFVQSKRSVHQQPSHEQRLIITKHSNHSRGVLLSATNSSHLYRIQPNIV